MRKNTTAKSPFSKLAHVGVVVRDMDKAIERLSSLGIGPFEAISVPPATGKPLFRGRPFDLDLKVKGLAAKIGEVKLELLQPVDGDSPWKEFLDSKGEGIHHIAFAVDDIDKEVAKFTEQGVSILLSGKWQGGGCAYLDLGVGGIIFELVQDGIK
jgi:methylmalonyl-CoA/ethylmalonyl-CoA epimerase